MLHSASSSGREDYAAQLPLLRRSFTCYLPDARGHATTRWDAADGFQYDWLVDDLEAFADALGLATFHLLGFSMGAATAHAVRVPPAGADPDPGAHRHLAAPRAAGVRRPADDGPGPESRRRTRAWAAELSRRHDPVQGVGAWQRLMPAIARDIAEQRLLEPADLIRIDAPTLVVVGDRDPFVPVDQAWALKRQLPDARLLVAPDCGHEVPMKRTALFNEAVAGFYRSTEAVATRRAGG